jgi:hypothetical protein
VAKSTAVTATQSEVLKFTAIIKTVTDMLGTAPSDPDIYSDFIVSKALTGSLYKATTKEEKATIRKALLDHELTLLPGQSNADALEGQPQSVQDVLADTGDGEMKGKTIFRKNAGGLVMLDYQIKGFFKAAAKATSDMFQPESRVDKWLFIGPREIPIIRGGAQIPQAEGESVRPLRIEDQRTGVSRTAIAVSEIVKPGATLTFDVIILPKGFSPKSNGGKFKKEDIKMWLEYGIFSGLGAWRNASHGAFELVKFEETPVTWAEAIEIRRKQLTTVFGETLADALVA